MMIREDGIAERGAAVLRAFQSVPGKLALGLLVLGVGTAASSPFWFPAETEDPASATAEVAGETEDVALVPSSRFALSATARGVEPEAAAPKPVLTPAVSTANWSLGAAEAHEASDMPVPRARPHEAAGAAEPEISPPVPAKSPAEAKQTDEPGAGGPFASWLPEPKPDRAPDAGPTSTGDGHRVNLAVVRYEQSADTIRQNFVRKVAWDEPLAFTLEPFGQGSLQVLSVTGLASHSEAARMCALAREKGFECVLPES